MKSKPAFFAGEFDRFVRCSSSQFFMPGLLETYFILWLNKNQFCLMYNKEGKNPLLHFALELPLECQEAITTYSQHNDQEQHLLLLPDQQSRRALFAYSYQHPQSH